MPMKGYEFVEFDRDMARWCKKHQREILEIENRRLEEEIAHLSQKTQNLEKCSSTNINHSGGFFDAGELMMSLMDRENKYRKMKNEFKRMRNEYRKMKIKLERMENERRK